VTVLGLTFKENIVDVRNSQVFDIIREFQSFGVAVQVHDPLAHNAAALKEYGLTLLKEPAPADGAPRWRCGFKSRLAAPTDYSRL
jgi:UDP-N-acetyl-D-galactosamine dehydrogenase